MRVAIVNDLRIATEALRRVVISQPSLSVAWTAPDGPTAIRLCLEDPPDVVLMDLLMPGMNGAEATRQIIGRCPCPILVVTSTVAGNFALVCQALGYGAFDAVCTPVLGNLPPAEAGAELLAKLRNVEKIRARLSSQPDSTPAAPCPAATRALGRPHFPLVAIGASTGGPDALRTILSGWPKNFPAGVLIAQHISAAFAPSLAAWLADASNLAVRTASQGDRPQPGVALVAATDDHLVLCPDGTLAYAQEPRDNPYRPSVDVLFESLARHWPGPSVALLLTGIGRDGAKGMLELRRAGWHTIAQDEATSVVYGMPQAAHQLGAAKEVLPLSHIAPSISRHLPATA